MKQRDHEIEEVSPLDDKLTVINEVLQTVRLRDLFKVLHLTATEIDYRIRNHFYEDIPRGEERREEELLPVKELL